MGVAEGAVAPCLEILRSCASGEALELTRSSANGRAAVASAVSDASAHGLVLKLFISSLTSLLSFHKHTGATHLNNRVAVVDRYSGTAQRRAMGQ